MAKPKDPNSEQIEVIDEILSLVESFRREVPAGRCAWPGSVRERVQWLHTSGMSYRQICIFTKIPYDTVVAWPSRVGQVKEPSFKALVVAPLKSDVGTAAVPTSDLSLTFDKYKIDGLSMTQLESLLMKFGITL